MLGDLASYVESLENPSGKDILTVFLTGDVHFGYCERIQLMQEIPRIPQRFLNLTASALKNEAGKTRFAQYVGVEFGWDGDPNPGNEEDKDENVIVKFDFVLDKGCVDKDDPRCLSPADCGPSTNSTVPPDALAANECAGRMHQKIAEGDSGREIVGHNNIAEIRFTPETGEGDARSVTQILYWNDEVEKETHYRVSLGPWA